jgi:mono/diheme cytochrome c family protein
MSSRGWWWQRLHPALRAVLALAYFGTLIAVIAFAATPSLRSESTNVTDEQVSESVTPEAEPSSTDPASTDPASTEPASDEEELVVLTGADLYETNCASCHGSSAEGGVGPALAAGSEAAEETDSRIIARIRDGKNAMPPFAGSLTDEEIELILEYLRESDNG